MPQMQFPFFPEGVTPYGARNGTSTFKLLPDSRNLAYPRGQKTHAATVEFSGSKRLRESSCPQFIVSVTE
jgi:hypothetical protein